MSYYKRRLFLGCVTTSDHYNTFLGCFCPFLCPPAPIQGPLWWCWSSACPFPRHIRAAFPFLQVNVIHTANPMEHASHIAAQPQFVHPEHRSFIDLSGHNLANPHPFAGRTVLPCPNSCCELSTCFPLAQNSHWPAQLLFPITQGNWSTDKAARGQTPALSIYSEICLFSGG